MHLISKKVFFFSGISVSFFFGALLFFFYTDTIIVRSPFRMQKNVEYLEKVSGNKRLATLYYWHEGSIRLESVNFVWDKDKSQSLSRLISLWLNIVHNEQLLDRKIILEAASISQEENCVYLSFSSTLFSSGDSTYIKWHMIEGLLKTISEMFGMVREVFFLVGHQPMKDSHLDFSQAWPIEGFEQD